MHSTSTISAPWAQDERSPRATFTSRFSGLFNGRDGGRASNQTPRDTATFEVPLFLSPTRYEPPQRGGIEETPQLSPVSHQSFDDGTCFAGGTNYPIRPSSSHYSSTEIPLTAINSSQAPVHMIPQAPVNKGLTARSKHGRPKRHAVRRKVHKKSSLRQQIQTSKHLSLAFGVTFLLATITYLVLATTGIASGVIFHIINVLLLLIIFGVCLHSSIRWVTLSRRRRARKQRPRNRDQWFGSSLEDVERADNHDLDVDYLDAIPEKPIQIIMKEDDLDHQTRSAGDGHHEIPKPPPIYGNFRTSKRINPELVHWHQVPPSPLTPTYAEAMQDVQRVVGYRPPSYVQSDNGVTQIIETHRKDVDEIIYHIQPMDEADGI